MAPFSEIHNHNRSCLRSPSCHRRTLSILVVLQIETYCQWVYSDILLVLALYEPLYEKTGFVHMRKTKTQIGFTVKQDR